MAKTAGIAGRHAQYKTHAGPASYPLLNHRGRFGLLDFEDGFGNLIWKSRLDSYFQILRKFLPRLLV